MPTATTRTQSTEDRTRYERTGSTNSVEPISNANSKGVGMRVEEFELKSPGGSQRLSGLGLNPPDESNAGYGQIRV